VIEENECGREEKSQMPRFYASQEMTRKSDIRRMALASFLPSEPKTKPEEER